MGVLEAETDGDEREGGCDSGSNVFVTGFELKVTVRAPRGRSVVESKGVFSDAPAPGWGLPVVDD